MDANALVGSVVSAPVGAHAPAAENDSGQHLRLAMGSAGLCLASTFAEVAGDAPSDTWVSSAGRGHRLDYIAIPSAWMHCKPRVYRPADLDLALER
eukprot:513336-Alexandrium_andersonii.AAC.1